DAVSCEVKITTDNERAGMPQMGSLQTHTLVIADLHDDKNLPFSAVKKFFTLANVVTRDKIKNVKVEYWKDDSHQDALASYAYKGDRKSVVKGNRHNVG